LAPWGFAGVFNFCADLRGMDNLYIARMRTTPNTAR